MKRVCCTIGVLVQPGTSDSVFRISLIPPPILRQRIAQNRSHVHYSLNVWKVLPDRSVLTKHEVSPFCGWHYSSVRAMSKPEDPD